MLGSVGRVEPAPDVWYTVHWHGGVSVRVRSKGAEGGEERVGERATVWIRIVGRVWILIVGRVWILIISGRKAR